MKRILKWTGVVLLSPVLLVLLLAALLYVPAVQNWAVQRVAAYASEQTGMDISVGHVDLSFPLDLQLDDVKIAAPSPEGDTIADIGRLVVDVRLWPLTKGQVVIDALELADARLNTLDFVGDLRLVGTVGQLALSSPGISLADMTAKLHEPRLRDADLTIFLSDTAAVDTTSQDGWRIDIDRLRMERTAINIVIDSAARFADSASRISVYMGQAALAKADLDLGLGRYALGTLDWADGRLSYDSLFALSHVQLGLDSLFYGGDDLRLGLNHASLREDSTGLQLSSMQGAVAMSGSTLRADRLQASTPYSTLTLHADIDIDSLAGQLDMDAQLGKGDLALLAPELKALPDWPLSLHAHAHGSATQLTVERLAIALPTAFQAEASGMLGNLTDTDRLQAQMELSATAANIDFAKPLLGLTPGTELPRGVVLAGNMNANAGRYDAHLLARQDEGSLRLALSGSGMDLASRATHIDLDMQLHNLRYDTWQIDSLKATALLDDGRAHICLDGGNAQLDGSATIDTSSPFSQHQSPLDATIDASVRHADLMALGLADAPVSVTLGGSLDLTSDLRQTHTVSALISDIAVTDTLKTSHLANLGLLLKTAPDTTMVRMQSGDLIVKFDAAENYERLFDLLTATADTIGAQLQSRTIDQAALKRLLPTARLYITSQQGNPVADVLREAAGISFQDLKIDLTSSAESGLNGHANLLALKVGDTPIDTIRLSLQDRGRGLTFNGQVTNNRKNPALVFNALFDGLLQEHGASLGVRYFDEQGRRSVRLGTKAEMTEQGLRMQLVPANPTLGYKEFTLNDSNYLLLHNNLKLEANVALTAADGTGIRIYSEHQDSTLLQDLTVSIARLDLDELTSGMPLLPRLAGQLNGDYHLTMDAARQISVASSMSVDRMAYEGSPIGNVSTDFVYLLREDDSHVVDATLSVGTDEVGTLQGSYMSDGTLDATLELTATPLSLINGFMPDQIIGFEGAADGSLTIKGPPAHLQMNGQLRFTDGYLVSVPYGMRMRFGDKPVTMTDSRLVLDAFPLYSYNENPLNINGTIDLSNTDNAAIDLRLGARNFQLVNAKQQKESVAYGRMFVNFFSRLTGTLDQLSMRGRLDILGTTDLNYILLDSPLSTDNRMDELVRFTDFSDTTQTIVERPAPDGLDINLSLNIDQGAHVKCALNADQTNYVDLFGGGDLRLSMSGDNMSLTGRYTMQSGTMKYSLPVIPLKTFTIKEGSYVEFTGEASNPTLNLTATERTRATVGGDDGQSRSVSFDVGVVITQTLENMGLQFTIAAPEDMQVQSELASMSVEQRGKLAVTMLTTGMYLSDGSTGGFSMNSALSSFLQSEINQITAGALKTMDLQVGLDNTTDASGQMHTDYSFRFAKRFWNNRLSVQIGGKVSTGTEVEGQQQSFFDNVTMEYRLSPTSNQYVKLFYNQNVYDWLEGYTGEYGAGFVWRRKLDSLFDIFKRQSSPLQPTLQPTRNVTTRNDSIRNDSIK